MTQLKRMHMYNTGVHDLFDVFNWLPWSNPPYVIDMVTMEQPPTPMSSLFIKHVYTIGQTLPREDHVIITHLYL